MKCKMCGHKNGEPTGEYAYGQPILYVVHNCLCQYCYFAQFKIFLDKRAGIDRGSGMYGEHLAEYDGTLFEGQEQ